MQKTGKVLGSSEDGMLGNHFRKKQLFVNGLKQTGSFPEFNIPGSLVAYIGNKQPI
jgi:hypothetical protein